MVHGVVRRCLLCIPQLLGLLLPPFLHDLVAANNNDNDNNNEDDSEMGRQTALGGEQSRRIAIETNCCDAASTKPAGDSAPNYHEL